MHRVRRPRLRPFHDGRGVDRRFRFGSTQQRVMRRNAAWMLCWVALAAAPLQGQSADQAPPPVLHDVHGVADLQAAFDQDRDKIRLVLLLSPT